MNTRKVGYGKFCMILALAFTTLSLTGCGDVPGSDPCSRPVPEGHRPGQGPTPFGVPKSVPPNRALQRAQGYPSLHEGFRLPPVEMLTCGGAVLP